MKRIVLLFPLAMGVVCGAYTGIYLVRWEWNRAMIAGLFFVAAEVIVASLLVLDRVRRSEERVLSAITALAESTDGPARTVDLDLGPVEEALRDSAPEPRDRFAWIRDQTGSMNVFLPVLLGAGVVASALAWVVEHVARATISPVLEHRLAHRLDVLALPAGGLLGPPVVSTAPRRRSSPSRVVVVIGALLAMAAITAAAIDYVADRTQTRPDVTDPLAETHVDLQLRGEVAARDPDRVIGHLWAVCTGPDVFRSRRLPAPTVEHSADGLVHVVVAADIGEHAMDRLTGCLNDTTLDKVQARVVSTRVVSRSD